MKIKLNVSEALIREITVVDATPRILAFLSALSVARDLQEFGTATITEYPERNRIGVHFEPEPEQDKAADLIAECHDLIDRVLRGGDTDELLHRFFHKPDPARSFTDDQVIELIQAIQVTCHDPRKTAQGTFHLINQFSDKARLADAIGDLAATVGAHIEHASNER